MRQFVFILQLIYVVQLESHFSIVGVVPETGELSDHFQSVIQGYHFFCDQLSQRGGFSLTHNRNELFQNNQGKEYRFYFNCTFYDDQSDLSLHLNKFGELIRDPHVDFLVAGHSLFAQQSITSMMNLTQKILIDCCAVQDDVFKLGFQNVFGISASNSKLVENTIKDMALKKIQNITIFYQDDDLFTKSVCESAILFAQDRRINIVVENRFSSNLLNETEIESEIENLVNQSKKFNSEAIIACVSGNPAEYLTLEITNQKLSLKSFFLTNEPFLQQYRQNVGSLSEYVLSAGQWHRGIKYNDPFFGNNSNFVGLYQKSFDQQPSQFSALASVTMEAYLEAIKSAFVLCDISRTNGSVEKLLYGKDTVFCHGKYYQGYDLVQYAMYKLKIDTFLGRIYFDQYRQNSGLVPPTIQILKSEQNPGKLEDYCVLPVRVAQARIIMPQPNRYPKQCDPGFRQTDDLQFDECKACPAGRRRCATCSQASCEYCSKNEYNNMTAQSECFECPRNTEAVVNGATDIQQCQCKPNYYNPNYQVGVACEKCPVGMVCPGHNQTVHAEYGYWISQKLPISVYQCGPLEICSGGEENFCKEGYTGLICNRCEEGYFNVLRACQKCPSTTTTILYVCGVVIFWWFLNSVLTRHVDCFGVILNWFQLLRIVGYFGVNWPSSIFLILSLSAVFAFEVDFMELTCLQPNWSFLYNFVVQLTLPVMVGILSAVSYFFSYFYYHYLYLRSDGDLNPMVGKAVSFFIMLPKSERELKSAYNLSVATFFSFVNGSYSAIMKDCFASFLCDEIGGEMVVKNNYEVGCDDPRAKLIRGLGILTLLVYIIPYPLYIITAIIQLKRQKAFHHQSKLERLGWFYKMYEVEWYWYELVLLGHRIIFMAIFFYVPSPMMQCIYATGITIALLLLQIYSTPYIHIVLDILQTFLQIALVLVLFSGLIFYNPLVLQRDRKIIEVFILCVLGLFVFIFVVFLLRDLLEKLVHVCASWKIKKATCELISSEEDNINQLMHVFELRYFIPWLYSSSKKEQLEMFQLSQRLGDYVSNESDTSYLSTTKEGRWWRELSQRFPEVIDFLAVVDEDAKKNFMKFVEVLYKDFYHHKGEGNIHQMINWQDRASIAQWLTQATPSNRKLFNTATLLVFKLAKGEHVAQQLKLRIASNGKLLQRQLQQSQQHPSQKQSKSKLLFDSPTRTLSQIMALSQHFNLDMLNKQFSNSAQMQPSSSLKQAKSAPLPQVDTKELYLDSVTEDPEVQWENEQEYEGWQVQGQVQVQGLRSEQQQQVYEQVKDGVQMQDQGQGQGQEQDRSNSPQTLNLLDHINSNKKTHLRRHNSDSGQKNKTVAGPWEIKCRKSTK